MEGGGIKKHVFLLPTRYKNNAEVHRRSPVGPVGLVMLVFRLLCCVAGTGCTNKQLRGIWQTIRWPGSGARGGRTEVQAEGRLPYLFLQ